MTPLKGITTDPFIHIRTTSVAGTLACKRGYPIGWDLKPAGTGSISIQG